MNDILISSKLMSTMITGPIWHLEKPASPVEGDCYIANGTSDGYIYDGKQWIYFRHLVDHPLSAYTPKEEQLERHPSLKNAWEEYLMVRKLLGV